MSYSPKPNTVAWRVILHLESLDIGAEITTGALGDALGVPSGSLQACLEGPINNGILFRRQKDKSSPVFWSLTDYSASEKVPPLSARSVFDAALTQIRTADVTPEAPRTAEDWMLAAAAGAEVPVPAPIWPAYREPETAEIPPPPDAATEAAQVAGKSELAEGHADKRPPRDGVESDRTPTTEPLTAVQTRVQAEATEACSGAGAVTPERTGLAFSTPRFALWSDGALEISREGAAPVVLEKHETQALIDYLDVMHGREVAA